jgi:hypothetical protein
VIAAKQEGGRVAAFLLSSSPISPKNVTEKQPAAAGVPNPPCADIKPM